MIILIADDENLVRLGLKKIIKDTYLENIEILEAKNGREMLEVCRNMAPDLAFVDIKMPLLNGLEAIEAAKGFCPDTTWIILSGFSEFKFAQNAISLGVKNYLLKPLESDAIQQILLDAQSTVRQKHIDSNHLFELQVSHLFNSPETTRSSSLFDLPSEQLYTAIHFYESDFTSQTSSDSLYKSMLPELRQWLSLWRSPEDYFALFCLQSGLLCLVLRASPTRTRRVFNHLSKPGMLHPLQDTSILYCQSTQGISELFDQNTFLQEHLPMALYMQKGIPHAIEEFHLILQKQNAFPFSQTLDKIMQAYVEKDEIRYQKYLEKLRNMDGGKELFAEFFSPIIDNLSQTLELDCSTPDYADFCRQLHRQSKNMYENAAIIQPNIIEQVKNYIEINYANDVSIISLGETFSLAPTYLSKIFHEKVGTKLIDYVMEVRIQNAKRLMTENPDILIKNVALLVGYYSTRHFKDIFLKQTGMLPSEFQKVLKGKPQAPT
ncbi:MAG: response regulator [Kineothrix sp.]|nr:response regulator [Kineothrix sp.]